MNKEINIYLGADTSNLKKSFEGDNKQEELIEPKSAKLVKQASSSRLGLQPEEEKKEV